MGRTWPNYQIVRPQESATWIPGTHWPSCGGCEAACLPRKFRFGELSESYRIVALVAFSNIYKNDLFVTSGEVLGLQTVYGHLGMSRSVMQSSAIFVDSIVFLEAAS